MATKDFVTYNPNSGNGSKDVSVSASKNTSSVSRSTTLNVQYKSINKNVNCSQKAAAINDGNIVQTQISSWTTQLLIDKGEQNNYHYKLIYPISNPTQENLMITLLHVIPTTIPTKLIGFGVYSPSVNTNISVTGNTTNNNTVLYLENSININQLISAWNSSFIQNANPNLTFILAFDTMQITYYKINNQEV